MDELIQTQKDELVNVQNTISRYLQFQAQSIRDLWQYINAQNPYGEISPAAFQQALGDMLNKGKIILNGGTVGLEEE